jgi:cytochrome c biogenesis factor
MRLLLLQLLVKVSLAAVLVCSSCWRARQPHSGAAATAAIGHVRGLQPLLLLLLLLLPMLFQSGSSICDVNSNSSRSQPCLYTSTCI